MGEEEEYSIMAKCLRGEKIRNTHITFLDGEPAKHWTGKAAPHWVLMLCSSDALLSFAWPGKTLQCAQTRPAHAAVHEAAGELQKENLLQNNSSLWHQVKLPTWYLHSQPITTEKDESDKPSQLWAGVAQWWATFFLWPSILTSFAGIKDGFSITIYYNYLWNKN